MIARKRAFKSASAWRPAAYASINANWKKMFPDGDREERLAWVAEYLNLRNLDTLTDLTDDQLGAVAGEMKRLVGIGASRSWHKAGPAMDVDSNVVQGDFGRERDADRPGADDNEIIHLASPEQVYTLDKLQSYLSWSQSDVFEFIKKRVIRGRARFSGPIPNFKLLTFRQATTATNALLHIAAHRDLKVRKGYDKKVSRAEVDKYIPLLKQQLGIDQ